MTTTDYSPSSTFSTSSTTSFSTSSTSYPRADVVTTNIFVECLRLSGGKNIVERCEKLWYKENEKNNENDENFNYNSNNNFNFNSNFNSNSNSNSNNNNNFDSTYDNDSTDTTQNSLTVKTLHLLNSRGKNNQNTDRENREKNEKNVRNEREKREKENNIYPNDYTFELMSRIWVENKSKDIAIRSQNLFDRYCLFLFLLFFVNFKWINST